MTIDDVVQMMGQSLFMVIKLSAPVLLVSLIVGLVISIFQTVTSIQEQTLTFVPKIVAVFLTLMIAAYWMLDSVRDYIIELWSDFAIYIR